MYIVNNDAYFVYIIIIIIFLFSLWSVPIAVVVYTYLYAYKLYVKKEKRETKRMENAGEKKNDTSISPADFRVCRLHP